MQRKPRTPQILDDDPMLFEAPPEWLVSGPGANDCGHPPDPDENGLRALASNVALLSRREWPRARAPRERLYRSAERLGLPRSA
jgi:hypothetical protein